MDEQQVIGNPRKIKIKTDENTVLKVRKLFIRMILGIAPPKDVIEICEILGNALEPMMLSALCKKNHNAANLKQIVQLARIEPHHVVHRGPPPIISNVMCPTPGCEFEYDFFLEEPDVCFINCEDCLQRSNAEIRLMNPIHPYCNVLHDGKRVCLGYFDGDCQRNGVK